MNWLACVFTKFVVVIMCVRCAIWQPMPYSVLLHKYIIILDCECIASFFWNSPSRKYWMTNIRNRQKCAPLFCSLYSYANSIRAFREPAICYRTHSFIIRIGHCTHVYCALRAHRCVHFSGLFLRYFIINICRHSHITQFLINSAAKLAKRTWNETLLNQVYSSI